MIKVINESYDLAINNIKEDIKNTQLNIMINSNISLVNLYYRIGKVLYENSSWGNKFIDKLAIELKETYPSQKGFSVRNLKYMKTFYNEYYSDLKFVQLVAQLPWTHNIILIDKIKDKKIREWYIKKCICEGWSKNVLIYQIDTNLYKRQEDNTKHNNFEITLNKNSELASNIMKDPYVFDFIELSDNFKEKELENKLLEKLKKLLLEFGKGFSFIGNQYKITVGNKDFYIDLLFYHIKLKCYIAVELKIDEFIPEYGSKIGFYLQALDEQVKDISDNPSIGLILCHNKDNKIVDYTLKYINKPVGVSSYMIMDELPSNYIENLPDSKYVINYLDNK